MEQRMIDTGMFGGFPGPLNGLALPINAGPAAPEGAPAVAYTGPGRGPGAAPDRGQSGGAPAPQASRLLRPPAAVDCPKCGTALKTHLYPRTVRVHTCRNCFAICTLQDGEVVRWREFPSE